MRVRPADYAVGVASELDLWVRHTGPHGVNTATPEDLEGGASVGSGVGVGFGNRVEEIVDRGRPS
jgi:hypothetical protein